MSSVGALFLITCGAMAFAHNVNPGHDICEFPSLLALEADQIVTGDGHAVCAMVDDAVRRVVGDRVLEPPVLQDCYLPIDSSCPATGTWEEARMQLDEHAKNTGNKTGSATSWPGTMNNWHHRKVDHLEFVDVEMLQPGRMQIVTHHGFDAPVLIKTAESLTEIPSLEREATVYRLLYGSGITPEFLGHVTDGERVIGFITEYIREVPSVRSRNMKGCMTALRGLHRRGIVHGDAHDGNCLIREDGSAVLIDFELSTGTWLPKEFERDLDIMERCIRAISGHS